MAWLSIKAETAMSRLEKFLRRISQSFSIFGWRWGIPKKTAPSSAATPVIEREKALERLQEIVPALDTRIKREAYFDNYIAPNLTNQEAIDRYFGKKAGGIALRIPSPPSFQNAANISGQRYSYDELRNSAANLAANLQNYANSAQQDISGALYSRSQDRYAPLGGQIATTIAYQPITLASQALYLASEAPRLVIQPAVPEPPVEKKPTPVRRLDI